MSPKLKFALLLIVGISAIGILTTMILILRKDRGFMVRECDPTNHPGVQAELRWAPSDMPVPVYLAAGEEGLEPDVREAIAFWRPYLMWGGFARPLDVPIDPAIIVDSMPMPADEDPVRGHATPKWISQCRIRRVEVTIPMPQMEGRARSCRVKHELGHALGLDHDDDEDSVMKAMRDWRFDCDLSEQDVDLLSEAYRQ